NCLKLNTINPHRGCSPTNHPATSLDDVGDPCTPAFSATGRASSLLPVPGGPTSRTPLGGRPPSRPYRTGFFKNSTISTNSSLASSTPATSAKVTLVSFST